MRSRDLSLAQRQYLQRLHDQFTVIEQHMKRKVLTLIAHLAAKVQDPADWTVTMKSSCTWNAGSVKMIPGGVERR